MSANGLRRQYLIIFFALLCCGFSSASQATPLHYLKPFRLMYLAVTVNAEKTPLTALFLHNRLSNNYYIASTDLAKLDLKVKNLRSVKYDGKTFYNLRDLPQIKFYIDKPESRIFMTIPGRYFPKHVYDILGDTLIKPQRNAPGAFMNYDLFAQRDQEISNSERQLNGIFDLGVFNQYGVGVADFLLSDKHSDYKDRDTALRLNTTWTIDMPSKMQSVRLGDSLTRPGLWGDSLSFGGFQWATNFATQPYFLTYPLPSARGLAVVPSTVDVYINNALQSRRQVGAGPFQINNIPVVNSGGDVQLVVTDLLGRQQVINMPYYASSGLLKKGLNNFSFSFGELRHNYGIASNDYRTVMAEATDSLGLTRELTGQIHSEVSGDVQNLGVGANMQVDHLGIFTMATAVSSADDTRLGNLFLFRFQHIARRLNFGVSSQITTSHFRLLSSELGHLPSRVESQAFMGLSLPHGASVGLSYIYQDNRDRSNIDLLSINYSRVLFKHVFLNISAMTNVSGQNSKSVFLTLSIPLDSRTTASTGVNWNTSGATQGTIGIQRNLPAGTGFGYHVRGAVGNNAFAQAGAAYQNSIGTYSASYARQTGENAYQVEARGALLYMDKHIGLSRQMDSSFALVEMPGFAHIPIYLENHKVAETNSRGYTFVPNLGAYTDNHMSINPNTLPLSASIAKDKLSVIPYLRSGVLVRFPVHQIRAGILFIHTPAGKPIPLSSVVTNMKTGAVYAVGHRGEVYLTDLQKHNRFNIKWRNHSCQVDVNIKQFHGAITPLGTRTCVRH